MKHIKPSLAAIKIWMRKAQNRVLLIALSAMFLIILLVQLHTPEEHSANSSASADTYIPHGFVLVPIEIQNAESLGSLVGEFAVVDLFKGPHSQRVGRRLKLLRAPLNPQQFAVLVPEGEVSSLLQTTGPFWAAIQNPTQNQSAEIASHGRKSRIEYFKDN